MPVLRAIFILTAVGLVSFPAQAKYSGGSGTAKDPWRIATKKDLITLAGSPADFASHFRVIADIDLSGQAYTMALIAPATKTGPNWTFEAVPFTGVFDGNGHKITALAINDGKRGPGYFGLFGCIGRGGLVTNLRLERVNITAGAVAQYVGGLAGLNDSGTITDCSIAGDITGAHSTKVGALAGENGTAGTIARCHVLSGTVRGGVEAGGLVGRNVSGARITDCDAADNVVAEGFHVGGLVGLNQGTIARCQATGSITHSVLMAWGLGGLVGHNDGMIIHCRATGSVTGERSTQLLGGLVGENGRRAAIIDCSATGKVTSEQGPGVGGLVGTNAGLVTHCCATGGVAGALLSGGLAGGNGGAITNCYATGSATGSGGGVAGGGLAGSNDIAGTIVNCYATGSVTGFSGAGGLAGSNGGAITNSYAVGRVTGAGTWLGGLVGLLPPDTAAQTANCFWDTQTSGQTKSKGGTGENHGPDADGEDLSRRLVGFQLRVGHRGEEDVSIPAIQPCRRFELRRQGESQGLCQARAQLVEDLRRLDQSPAAQMPARGRLEL